MTPESQGAVDLVRGAKGEMQHCYVEVRVRGCWAQVADGNALQIRGNPCLCYPKLALETSLSKQLTD
jgi:hypothetical protein